MKPRTPKLSPRELAVVRLLASEFSQKEISGQLGISASAVRGYLQRCMFKTNTRTVVGLVLWFARCSENVSRFSQHDGTPRKRRIAA